MMGDTTRRDLLRAGATGAALAAGATALGRTAAEAAATEDPGKRPPNILVLMCDQERYPQWTPDLPTPARDWIDGRGVSFERFHHTAVMCSPSRACFWTGLYPTQHGVFGNFLQGYQYSLDSQIPTVGDLLRDRGYTTAYFGKWHLSIAGLTVAEGPTDNASGNYLGPYGFDYSAQSPSTEPFGYNDGVYNDPIWTRQAVDWLGAHGGQQRPWFMVVSLLNPHDIAYFPNGFSADPKRPDWQVQLPLNFDDDPSTKPKVHEQYHNGIAVIRGNIEHDDLPLWKRLLNTYCDLIVNSDENLAAIVKALHDSGGMENTVIMRTADHGELGGSHRAAGKGPLIYEEQVRMPLSISWPKRFATQKGARTRALAEAVDLVPTCLELAGVADPSGTYPWLRGRSLVPALEDPAGARGKDFTLTTCDEFLSIPEYLGQGASWRRHVRGALSGRFKVARYFAMDGNPLRETDDVEYELYDLYEDPYELRNLARDPAYKPLLRDMLARLHDLEKERLSPVEVPSAGPASLLEPIRKDPIGRPQTPLHDIPANGAPVAGVPGAYVQVPVGDPHLEEEVYGSRQPQTADGTRERAEARARYRAAMLCELGPR